MLTILFRSPDAEYITAMQSVELINRLLDLPSRTAEQFQSLANNAEHLKSVLLYPIWTHHDMDPIEAAIDRVAVWQSLEDEPVEETPIMAETPSEYPWGNRVPTQDEVDAFVADLRSRKDKEINTARLAANNTFFTYLGKKIACDTLSRSDIDGANGYITLHNTLPAQWPGGWKTMDNSYVPIATVTDWTNFYTAMYQQGLLNFAKSQQLKQQIASAPTIEALRQINW